MGADRYFTTQLKKPVKGLNTTEILAFLRLLGAGPRCIWSAPTDYVFWLFGATFFPFIYNFWWSNTSFLTLPIHCRRNPYFFFFLYIFHIFISSADMFDPSFRWSFPSFLNSYGTITDELDRSELTSLLCLDMICVFIFVWVSSIVVIDECTRKTASWRHGEGFWPQCAPNSCLVHASRSYRIFNLQRLAMKKKRRGDCKGVSYCW